MGQVKSLFIETVNELESFALAHYEAGGHWVVECFDIGNYMEVLERTHGNIPEAKEELRNHWEMLNEREADCASGENW